jgi:hypothetical protein
MNKGDFKHLRQLADARPKTKAGLIQVLWPEIRQALDAGHTIAEVLGALNKDRIQIAYSTFQNRIAKLKKKGIAEIKRPDSDYSKAVGDPASIHSDDPASAIRAQRAKKAKFDHDPFAMRVKDLVQDHRRLPNQ